MNYFNITLMEFLGEFHENEENDMIFMQYGVT